MSLLYFKNYVMRLILQKNYSKTNANGNQYLNKRYLMKYSLMLIIIAGCLNATTQDELIQRGLIQPGHPIKLHLGCGESRLQGYINIDFAADQHTVQTQSGADYYADLTSISFEENSISEIRLHHVFEHFDRPTALALLCKWHMWLKIGGTLVLETPDFEESIKSLLDPKFSYKTKQAIMRHIFGSHEASWALHFDGWYEEKFRHVLSKIGYNILSCDHQTYLFLKNITVVATKKAPLSALQLESNAALTLLDSLVNEVESEISIWRTWCNKLRSVVQS